MICFLAALMRGFMVLPFSMLTVGMLLNWVAVLLLVLMKMLAACLGCPHVASTRLVIMHTRFDAPRRRRQRPAKGVYAPRTPQSRGGHIVLLIKYVRTRIATVTVTVTVTVTGPR